MSGVVEAWVSCDGCEAAGEDTGAYGVGSGFKTITAVREAAHRDGWVTVTRRGNRRTDFCGECVSEGRA